MEAVVRRATRADLFSVFQLVRHSNLNDLPLAARQRGFFPVWGGQEPYSGYLLEDAGKVVGFLGTLHTRREVRGKLEDFCELHGWYVRKDYRNQSLHLLMPVIGQRRNKTIINFTPSQRVYDISRKFGFQDLETALLLLFPVPTGARRVEIVTDPWRVPDYLDGEDLRIFQDHKDVFCHHIVLLPRDEPRGAPVYLVMKTMRRRWFEHFGRVLHVSDRERLAALLGSVGWRLCARFHWVFMTANDRDFENIRLTVPSTRLPRDVPSQFLSSRLQASDITQLYSQPLLMGYPLH